MGEAVIVRLAYAVQQISPGIWVNCVYKRTCTLHGSASILRINALTSFADGTIWGLFFAVWNDDGSEEFVCMYGRVEEKRSVLG